MNASNHHCIHQRGFAGRPQSVHLLYDAAMDSSTPKLHPAPGKTGEDLDTCSFSRAQGDDSVFCQITPVVVKRTRIAVIAGQRNLGGEAQALSVGEQATGAVVASPNSLFNGC
jgi:hypothetical protein